MDVGIDLLWDVPGALIAPPGAHADSTTMHLFTGIQVTAKGVDHLASSVDVIRSVALEHHAAEVEFWHDLVADLPRPLTQNGFITVPDTPGLGSATSTRNCCAATSTRASRCSSPRRRPGTPSRATTGCGGLAPPQAGPCSARHRSYSGRASSDRG